MCTFKIAAEMWQKDYQSQIEYYTYKSYVYPANQVVLHFGERNLSTITPYDIKQFLDILALENKSHQTINLRLVVINHVFRYAIVMGLCKENPAEIIRLPRNLPKGSRSLPPDDEITLVKSICASNDYWIMAKCILFLGLRRGEVLAITKNDIDFTNSRLTVDKQIEFRENKSVVKYKTKSKAGCRNIIIPKTLLEILKQLSEQRKHYIFCDNNGNLLTSQALRKGWASMGLTSTMHQFRHAYATILYEAGVDEKVAQIMMGHSSPITTRKIHTHLRESQVSKAENLINQYLFTA